MKGELEAYCPGEGCTTSSALPASVALLCEGFFLDRIALCLRERSTTMCVCLSEHEIKRDLIDLSGESVRFQDVILRHKEKVHHDTYI